MPISQLSPAINGQLTGDQNTHRCTALIHTYTCTHKHTHIHTYTHTCTLGQAY